MIVMSWLRFLFPARCLLYQYIRNQWSSKNRSEGGRKMAENGINIVTKILILLGAIIPTVVMIGMSV